LVYGGLGRHVHGLAQAQARLGHDVTVLTQSVEGTTVDERVGGVRIVRVGNDIPGPLHEDLLGWVAGLGRALTRAGLRVGGNTKPEVLHAHDWVTCDAGLALQLALRVPLVATVHATESGRHQGWLPGSTSRGINATEVRLTGGAARVITCSKAMREEVIRLFDLSERKVDVIANGIDLAQWPVAASRRRARARASWAPHGPLIVCAGRLEYEKGIHTLLDALPRLRRQHPGLRAVVAGRGTYSDELKATARRLRLGSSVTFAGFLTDHDLAELVGAADVAVVPSLYEPFGMVALEAVAVGTPLVAADTGGLRELVEPAVTGLRFPAGNAGELARAVHTQLEDPVSARRMARTARARLATGHDWSSIAAATAASYRNALADWAPHNRVSAAPAPVGCLRVSSPCE